MMLTQDDRESMNPRFDRIRAAQHEAMQLLAMDAPWDRDTARDGGAADDSRVSPLGCDGVPGYTIVRELHRGGQGVVFQAVHQTTTRKVAIKVMREGPVADDRHRARFQREVQILAQLEHPNIVKVHDSGMVGGAAYYVMDYVAGQPLDAYVAAVSLSLRGKLDLFARICEAVNAAHLAGVIHRDLKPSNVRIDAQGQAHILDFGLAKVTTDLDRGVAQAMTVTGQFVGSLPWASPEQADGGVARIDVRSDVYSLGVILYQMLTGRFPYDVVGNMRDVLNNIARAAPIRPRALSREIDDELDTIILKCLAKERERRYQSAGELARDIRRYLAGEPIEAKRDSAWYVARKAIRRHKAAVAVATGFLVLVLAFSAVMTLMYQRTRASEQVARQAQSNAETLALGWYHDNVKAYGRAHPAAQNALAHLIRMYAAWGRSDESQRYRALQIDPSGPVDATAESCAAQAQPNGMGDMTMLREFAWSDLKRAQRLQAGTILPAGRDATFEHLKVESPGSSGGTTPLLTIDKPGITASSYALTGQLRYEDVDGDGYLEMWSHLDGAPYFSRTLTEGGPTGKLHGDSPWRTFMIPFYLQGASTTPERLELNVVLPGKGTVWFGPVRLVQFGETAAQPAAPPKQAAAPAAGPPVVRADKLDNGITLLMHAIPGAPHVSVEAFYRVGFVHEPKGMTQAAHLLEHLVCNAATSSYSPGESMTLLNSKGMANAETLPDWTHYDYTLPAGELELALRIEAERLTSLKITKEMILQESPRCYSEADHVERIPQAGMLKHAFMAYAQSWRHGLDHALIRGGMEAFSVADLEKFHRATYRPDNLVLVIVGGFDLDQAAAAARKHLGGIRAKGAKAEPIDWSKTPRHSTVKWDSKVSAVCVAFAPPKAFDDRILLSLWGTVVQQRLMTDAELMSSADMVTCSNHLWTVGDLPFHLYAAAKPDADLKKLESLLVSRATQLAAQEPSQADLMQVHMMADQLAYFQSAIDWAAAQQQANALKSRGFDETRAIGMVLGQSAINRGVAHLLLGSDAKAAIQRVKSASRETLHRAIRQTLSDNNRIVTSLVPDGG